VGQQKRRGNYEVLVGATTREQGRGAISFERLPGSMVPIGKNHQPKKHKEPQSREALP